MTKILIPFILIITSCGIYSLKDEEIKVIKKDTKKIIYKMPERYDLSAKDVYKRVSCNDCHEKLDKKFHHAGAKTSCLNCHLPHSKKPKVNNLLRVGSKQMCAQCHKEKDVHLNNMMIKNHPINKKVTCLNCHDPHSSNENKYLIRFNYGNDTKYKNNMCAYCHWSKSYEGKPPH